MRHKGIALVGHKKFYAAVVNLKIHGFDMGICVIKHWIGRVVNVSYSNQFPRVFIVRWFQ